MRLARRAGKPLRVIDLADPRDDELDATWRWLDAHGVRTLNVAGPRASQDPGLVPLVRRFLRALFSPGTPRSG